LSGGIRPLNLDDDEISDLVSFLETLTSPQFAAQRQAARNGPNPPPSCNVKTTDKNVLAAAGVAQTQSSADSNGGAQP
jgi:hypothetical protein